MRLIWLYNNFLVSFKARESYLSINPLSLKGIFSFL